MKTRRVSVHEDTIVGAVVMRRLLSLFVVKVIFPAAMENRERPSDLWRYAIEGFGWIVLLTFLVFLTLLVKLLFEARPAVK